MPDTTASSGSTWNVIGQSQTKVQQPNGDFIDSWVVSFRTGEGNVGTVTIPENQYNQAKVRAAIADKAALLDSIGSLSS